MVGHIQLLEILFNLKAEKTMNVTVPSDQTPEPITAA